MTNRTFTKKDIFNDIQKILQVDYAGYLDKKNINHPENYMIDNNMSDREFEETIQDYLLDFQDGHLWFFNKNKTLPNRGFFVRRYKNILYVTDSPQEKRLVKGDKICKIDGQYITSVAIKYEKRLEEKDFERQQWDAVIRRSDTIEVERKGEHFELALADYEDAPYRAEHSFKLLNNQTAYMKLTDFSEEWPILKIARDNQEILNTIDSLIIDVRVNNGGNDTFYFPLLHYVFTDNLRFYELFAKNENMYTNYTKRNCKLWIQELQDYLKQDLDRETAEMIRSEINTAKRNFNKGLLEVPEDEDFLIQGTSRPNNIYVLSDYYCGSSGDTFVLNLKRSPKVTVVGRPTQGIMDYFDVVTVNYGNFEFCYGISKMHSDYLINGKGVEPHIYVPWTPEHLVKDVDLDYVLELIKGN